MEKYMLNLKEELIAACKHSFSLEKVREKTHESKKRSLSLSRIGC